MRDAFRGYYPPTEHELKDMWTRGLVILDTNALLNLFRYTEKTRMDFLKVLEAKRTQLWIPHQVGVEFHRRRIEVINAQERAFADLESTLTSAQNSIQNTVNRFKRHPSLDTATLSELLERSVSDLRASVNEAQQRHAGTVLAQDQNQQTLESITGLYAGRVGDPYSAEELDALYKRGADRYDKQVPPGFKDKDKSEPGRYGDLVLWDQILRKARESKLPALFITDDAKEDWWYIVDGDTQGPRVELVDEYWEAAEARIHFYAPDRFAEMFARAPGSTISPESVAEVEKVSRARPQRSHERLSSLDELEAERRHLISVLNSRRPSDRRLLTPPRSILREEISEVSQRIDLQMNRLRKLEQALERFESRLFDIDNDEDRNALIPEQESLQEERLRMRNELDHLMMRHDALRDEYTHAPDEAIYADPDMREIQRRVSHLEHAIRLARRQADSDDES